MRPVGCLLTVLITLVVLAVAADLIAEEVAERRIASRLESELGTRPDVEITGFPFLTQVLGRNIDQIEVTGGSAGASGRVQDLNLQARDVDIVSTSQLQAGSVSGTGLVPWSAMVAASGEPDTSFARAGDGIRVTRELDLLGQDLTVSAEGPLSIEERTVVFRPDEFDIEGDIRIPNLEGRVGDQFAVRVPLEGLPDSLDLSVAGVEDAGVRVSLSGTDLALSGG
jgi:hypothetical protein